MLQTIVPWVWDPSLEYKSLGPLAQGVPEDFLSWSYDQSVRQLITGCLTQVLCHCQGRSPTDACDVGCTASPSSVEMSTQLPLESGASS